MKQHGQSLPSGNLQGVLDSASNAGIKGTQQYLTDPALAAALASILPKAKQTAVDLTCGTGALLLTSGAKELLGADIEPEALRNRLAGDATLRWSLANADLTLLYPLLHEVDWLADLFVLNPPFSLQWETSRLIGLKESANDAVRAAFPSHKQTIDSTLATLLIALDRCTLYGEGYLLCNESTAHRLLGSPDSPSSPLMKNIWLWLSLPEGTFTGADFKPCVLYFADATQNGRPFHITCPSKVPADIAKTLESLYYQRPALRRGMSLSYREQGSSQTLPLWRTCVSEYRTRHDSEARPSYNIWLQGGRIHRHLTPFDEKSRRIPRQDAIALNKLAGQSPFALVMQKETREAFLRAVNGTIWRVHPEVIAALGEAMKSFHRERSPLYPPNPTQCLGWLDEADHIKCGKALRAPKANPKAKTVAAPHPFEAEIQERFDAIIDSYDQPTVRNFLRYIRQRCIQKCPPLSLNELESAANENFFTAQYETLRQNGDDALILGICRQTCRTHERSLTFTEDGQATGHGPHGLVKKFTDPEEGDAWVFQDPPEGVIAGTNDTGDYYQSETRLAQLNRNKEWIALEKKKPHLTGFKPVDYSEIDWLTSEKELESESQALAWVAESAEPEDNSPADFIAGKTYRFTSESRTFERPSTHTNAVTGETEDTIHHGQELIITIHGEFGAHEFGDFTKEEAKETASVRKVTPHSLLTLLEHFEIPAVQDASKLHSERYQASAKWLHSFETAIQAAWHSNRASAAHPPLNASAEATPIHTAGHSALSSQWQPITGNNGLPTLCNAQLISGEEPFSFYPFQKEDLSRGSVFGGCLFGWEPGLGKTIALLLFGLLNGAKRHLLVAPEGLHAQIILEARTKFGIIITPLGSQAAFLADKRLQQWQADHLAGRDSAVEGFWITSYTQLGYNGADEWDPKKAPDGELMVSKKILNIRHSIAGWDPKIHDKSIGEVRQYADGRQIHCICLPTLATLAEHAFDYVGCDEAVRLKGNDSYISTGVRKLKPTKARLVLTGTPVKNHLDDIFWLLWWASGGHAEATARFPYDGTTAAKEQFAKEFMVVEENLTQSDKKKKRVQRRIPRLCNIHRLWKLFGPLIIRRRKRDISKEMVPKTIIPIKIKPGKAQLAVYQHHLSHPPDFSKEGKPLNPMTRMLAQLQCLRIAALCPSSPLLQHRRVKLQPVLSVLKPTDKAATDRGVKVARLAERTPFDGERAVALAMLESMLAGESSPDPEALCKAAPSLADKIRAAVQYEDKHPSARSWTPWNPKVAAILAQITELIGKGEQVVVMVPFVDFGRDLYAKLIEAGVATTLLDGDTSPAKRGAFAAEFKAGKYAVLIGGQQSMGEGHSFECCANLILPSISWALDVNQQSEDRVHRIRSRRPVQIYTFATENTIDVRLESLYREKGDAAGLALDGEISERSQDEINLFDLLREAMQNFDPKAEALDEKDIESQWPQTRDALRAAMERYKQFHPPVTATADGTRVTRAEVTQAVKALTLPAANQEQRTNNQEPKPLPFTIPAGPQTPAPKAKPSLIAGVTDATINLLLSRPIGTDTAEVRAGFDAYVAALPSSGYRWGSIWPRFAATLRKPTPAKTLDEQLAELKNVKG